MKRITAVGDRAQGAASSLGLTLSFELRRRSRLLARLDDGEEAQVVLPRGTVLEDGDVLLLEDGTPVRVRAAAEALSRATAASPLLLARAAYHLGNRHIPVQVGEGFLAYQHDHVLDDMVRRLGLEVTSVAAPFEPESGAYGGHGHSHGAGHGHGFSDGGHDHHAHDHHAHDHHAHDHHAHDHHAHDHHAHDHHAHDERPHGGPRRTR